MRNNAGSVGGGAHPHCAQGAVLWCGKARTGCKRPEATGVGGTAGNDKKVATRAWHACVVNGGREAGTGAGTSTQPASHLAWPKEKVRVGGEELCACVGVGGGVRGARQTETKGASEGQPKLGPAQRNTHKYKQTSKQVLRLRWMGWQTLTQLASRTH